MKKNYLYPDPNSMSPAEMAVIRIRLENYSTSQLHWVEVTLVTGAKFWCQDEDVDDKVGVTTALSSPEDLSLTFFPITQVTRIDHYRVKDAWDINHRYPMFVNDQYQPRPS